MSHARELGVELGGCGRLLGLVTPRNPRAAVFATLRARARPNRVKLCRGRFSRPAGPLDPRGELRFRPKRRRQSGLKVILGSSAVKASGLNASEANINVRAGCVSTRGGKTN